MAMNALEAVGWEVQLVILLVGSAGTVFQPALQFSLCTEIGGSLSVLLLPALQFSLLLALQFSSPPCSSHFCTEIGGSLSVLLLLAFAGCIFKQFPPTILL